MLGLDHKQLFNCKVPEGSAVKAWDFENCSLRMRITLPHIQKTPEIDNTAHMRCLLPGECRGSTPSLPEVPDIPCLTFFSKKTRLKASSVELAGVVAYRFISVAMTQVKNRILELIWWFDSA